MTKNPVITKYLDKLKERLQDKRFWAVQIVEFFIIVLVVLSMTRIIPLYMAPLFIGAYLISIIVRFVIRKVKDEK